MDRYSVSDQELIALGKDVLRTEASAVLGLVDRVGDNFICAVRLMLQCKGRVVVSGIGKSGHIGRKIAATLASTGTPAFFVHPAEACHGDLGMITSHDVVIAISNSGESTELVALVPLLKRRGTGLISITGVSTSSLATVADIHLDARVEREACPLGLAPTSSTTATLALGDALAVALLKARGFGSDDFARSHPGGKLGRRLLVRVSDVMHTDKALPLVESECTLAEALLEMSAKGLGMTAVVNSEQRLLGLFTDGDLRRALAAGADLREASITDLMTKQPQTIRADSLAAEAFQVMEAKRINGLLVTDEHGLLIGMFNMHDLFRAGVV